MKHYIATRIDLKEVGEADDLGTFEGYAAVFNELVPSYNEIVKPGSFKRTINATKGGRVPILFMHGGVFGMTASDWIGMNQHAEEQSKGLFVRGGLTIKTSDASMQVYGLMKMSAELDRPTGLSIGFSPIRVVEQTDKPTEIQEVRLWEYSITPPDFQAAPNAGTTAIRSNGLMDAVVQCLVDLGVSTPALEQYQAVQLAADEGELANSTSPQYDPVLLERIREQVNSITTKLAR